MILDVDKKRHDEALGSHPKYVRNEREKERERERDTHIDKVGEKKFVLHISTILSNIYICVYIVSHAVK